MVGILAIITQLLSFLPITAVLTILQTLLSTVMSLTTLGLSPDQIVAKIVQALGSFTL